MTPQTQVYVTAPIAPDKEQELRRLLESMNAGPGEVRPDNPLFPFAAFDTIHFARWLIVDDKTQDDTAIDGGVRTTHPPALAFAAEIDGEPEAFFADMAAKAGPGTTALFACCEGFSPAGDLAGWLRAHHIQAAAGYVNWVGRTVRKVREEAALYDAVQRHLQREWPTLANQPAYRVHLSLRELVWGELAAGQLTLTPDAPTPLGWRLRTLAHRVLWPLLLVVLSPLLVPLAVVIVLVIRRREPTETEICPRTDPAHVASLAVVEDHDVTNSFSAMGSLKRGLVRRWATGGLLWAINFAARHVYTRGRFARVRTIHFARWVFLDDKTRVIFLSNYDDSLESYMDDFINKVGFGLNLSFCHGIGYPRTKWILFEGSSDERKFKEYLRRHQLPTQVWYKAYPGLTAVDLERHSRVRAGLESASLGGHEAAEWVELL
ncbi:MAG TPA: hypothetical protein VMW48_09410 [Vicinamibacterales bacterium]|nr:hypothetical protein [Vicinamibacterales bacterium]